MISLQANVRVRLIINYTFLLLFLISCSTTLKPPVIDPTTSYFPTESKIPSNGVLVEEPFLERYKNLLFVYTTPNTSGDFRIDQSITQSFLNMEVFKKVVTKYQMEQLVYDNNLQDEVQTMTDRLELHNLYNNIGDFLMVRIDVEWFGDRDNKFWEMDFQVFDPKNGKLVLHIRNQESEMGMLGLTTGIDEGLLYPMYNAFLEWARGEKITKETGSDPFVFKK
jgi:hypothetical protein